MTAPSPKVALVTGAAKRVGKVVALNLAPAGYRVAVHYRGSQQEALRTKEEIERLGGSAMAIYADLSKEAEVQLLFDEIRAAFGRLDAIVCSASTWLNKPLEETTQSDVMVEF